MASKRRKYTAGRTTAQLAALDPADINKLTRAQLAEVVSDIGATVNKRIKSAKAKGLASPALYNEEGWQPLVSARGKTLSELRSEYMRAKLIYQGKTSTIKGIKKWKEESIKEIAKYGIKLSSRQFDTFWKIYEEIRKRDARVEMKGLKYNVLSDIDRLMATEQDPDKISEYFTESQVTEIYKRAQLGEDQDDGTSISSLFKRGAEKVKRRTGFGSNH